jgi:hypothetical protein
LIVVTDPIECALIQRCFMLNVIRLVGAMPQFLINYASTLWDLLLQLQEGSAFLTMVSPTRIFLLLLLFFINSLSPTTSYRSCSSFITFCS